MWSLDRDSLTANNVRNLKIVLLAQKFPKSLKIRLVKGPPLSPRMLLIFGLKLVKIPLRVRGSHTETEEGRVSIKMYTPSCKTEESARNWVLIDAEDVVLGRLASTIAKIIRGKHKATYTPHNDCGDHVVVVNAEKIHLTGRKRQNKVYYRHSGYPGGLKKKTAAEILEGRFPERVLSKAVERMMPDGSLARKAMKKLHVYAGPSHPHEAQQPTLLAFAECNDKNKKRSA